ncbi:hypothetical protein L9W92_01845 [Pelotomaculum terephthalicicum JT]|nr:MULTISPECIES: hypothetical protein [Pelotomaculum]MCG9966801.1 hypothetical protein [Pelotomaculum terephthalicicum JT]
MDFLHHHQVAVLQGRVLRQGQQAVEKVAGSFPLPTTFVRIDIYAMVI